MVDMSLVGFSKVRAELALTEDITKVKEVRDKAETLKNYAKQQHESLEMQNQCAEVCLWAERRAGELLETIPKNEGGRPPKNLSSDTTSFPTLPDLGITRDQSSAWQRIAGLPQERFEQHIVETKNAGKELTTAGMLRFAIGPHVRQASGENEWHTPPEYIEAAKETMGGIDCDPASSVAANKLVKAKAFYTIKDDGRKQKWGKRVWMNPPYAQPLIAEFSELVAAKHEAGEVEQACILVNNATETAWFIRMLRFATRICFVQGRVKFLDPDGNEGAPLQGQAILYMGGNGEAFEREFAKFGEMLRHV